MTMLTRAVCVTLLGVVACGSLRSGEDNDLRALIAKAIEARGGAQNDAKYKAVNLKGSGTFYGLGEGIPYTGEWHIQGDKQARFALEIKAMGQTLTVTQVINDDKGWLKLNDEVKDLSAAELAEEKNEMYANWVTTLTPLKDKAFKLATLGELKIGDRTAVGVRVSRDGKRDINLFFDKARFLLVKNEHQVKDVKGGADKEMTQEAFFDEYKDFGGTKFATKIVIKRDGKQFVDGTMSEVRPLEMIDAGVFTKP